MGQLLPRGRRAGPHTDPQHRPPLGAAGGQQPSGPAVEAAPQTPPQLACPGQAGTPGVQRGGSRGLPRPLHPLRAAPRQGPLQSEEAARSGNPPTGARGPGAPKRRVRAGYEPCTHPQPGPGSSWRAEAAAPAAPLTGRPPPSPPHTPTRPRPLQQRRALLASRPLTALLSASTIRIG